MLTCVKIPVSRQDVGLLKFLKEDPPRGDVLRLAET